MANKKLAFIWDFTVSPKQLYTWEDGLNAALRIIANKYNWDVRIIAKEGEKQMNEIYEEIKAFDPDYILGWGSLDRPSFAGLDQFGKPVGLCFAGGPTEHPNTETFDIIFCENKSYLEAFKKQDLNVVQAMGTNHLIFKPYKFKKKFIACYPASFARWKRHWLFAGAAGDKGIALGKYNELEHDCWDICVKSGVYVLDELPYRALPDVYNQSIYTLITAENIGGGQRNVLESMACNIPPIVMSDSDKNTEFVKESGFGFIVEPTVEAIQEQLLKLPEEYSEKGRDFIMNNYSAEIYADKIYKGLTSC